MQSRGVRCGAFLSHSYDYAGGDHDADGDDDGDGGGGGVFVCDVAVDVVDAGLESGWVPLVTSMTQMSQAAVTAT